ncbi:MAG: CCA tRNA nucleotidyltransferase [Candidatus Hydrogenedentota bacterium]
MDDRFRAATDICMRLSAAGHRALLAGGSVRDMILKVPAQDYDIATSAPPDEIARLFEKTINVGAAFGVVVVVLPAGSFEVATFRKDGPYLDGRHPAFVTYADEEEDARRRDFTVNALFYDPLGKTIVDYVGGQQDIERRVIRAVGDPEHRFDEDKLRLLRAVRFAARLDYAIDGPTFEAMRRLAPTIRATSAERIRDEILKMLTEGRPRHAFEWLDRSGLLHEVLPEIEAMKGVQQPPEFHPEGDVFVHTLMMLDELQSPSPTLALGSLLHDVGKPPTMTFEDRIRFNNHDKVGAAMAEAICRRLRISNSATERVAWLVGQHMRVAHIPSMRESKRKRFIREDGFDELLALCRADCRASHGDESTIDWIEDYKQHLPLEQVKPAPLISGADLMAMGFKPGPLFKEILSAVEDAQLEGRVSNPEEACRFVASKWATASSSNLGVQQHDRPKH